MTRILTALCALLGFVFTLASSGGHAADEYPSRSMRWVVPTAPSGGTDFLARLLGQKVSETLRQPVVIDNRAGASGMLGMELVAKAPADGYTLEVFSVTPFISALASRNLSFDISKDFAPVSLLAFSPLILVAHPSVKATTVQGLVALAKEQPGKLNYASAGNGSITHLAGELFKRRAGVDILHVPYKGTGPAMVDVLAGHVQIAFATPSSVMQYIKTGRLRAIGVASAKRVSIAPEIPTFQESGVANMLVEVWYGMLAPANTPAAVTDKLSQTMATTMASADVRAKMSAEGSEGVGGSAADFKTYLNAEYDKWNRLFREIDFKVD